MKHLSLFSDINGLDLATDKKGWERVTDDKNRVDDDLLKAMINTNKMLYSVKPTDPEELREYVHNVCIRWALEELLERRGEEKNSSNE